MRCPECGVGLKRDYLFCNVCGHHLSDRSTVKSTPAMVQKSRPRIVSETPSHRTKVVNDRQTPLRHKNLLYVLLTSLAMTPLTAWVSYDDISLGIPAVSIENFYGRYITLVAAFGILLLLMEDKINDARMKRVALVGVGTVSVLISLADIMQVLELQSENYFFLPTHVGLGIYMALAASISLIVVALPKSARAASHRTRVTYEVRPGSPGSGP